MANQEHLKILKQGVEAWNRWRNNLYLIPDLSGVNLSKENLSELNLSGADLSGANLSGADLSRADLSATDLISANLSHTDLYGAILADANLEKADLSWVDLRDGNLSEANLSGANLREADLKWANIDDANLRGADLSKAILDDADLNGADLSGANLRFVSLVKTNFEGAKLTGCYVYGISAWDLILKRAEQSNLVITPDGGPNITADDLEVAQFLYLLLNNERIRRVIDTITTKVVLILGRFTEERKAVLEALRDALRQRDYLPVLFDWEKPTSRDFIETVSTIAHLAKFVIADVTDSKIVLEELPHIVRNVAVAVKPLMLEGTDEPVTLYNLRINHRSLLDTYYYKNLKDLLTCLDERVIIPSEAKSKELIELRREL